MTAPKNPVLLIHGLDDTVQIFDKMVRHLRDRGWTDIHATNLVPSNGDTGLDQLAEQVRTYVNNQMSHADAIDLVGFSMGGMVSRYYLQQLGGVHKVQRFVTLSAPNEGTWTAYFRQNRGARQMRPGSSFMTELNRSADALRHVACTSVWTPFDLMIIPASSSRLPLANTVQLPVLAHPLMLTDERVLNTVTRALSAPTLSQDTAASSPAAS